jgi:hypothetical protein
MDKYSENRYVKKWSLIKRAIDLLGGKCSKCGETHVAALSFHHVDPSKKEHLVSRMFSCTVDWLVIEKEVLKCVLFCENCHRKFHFNQNRFDKHYDLICRRAAGEKIGKEVNIRRWSDADTKKLRKLVSKFTVAEIAARMDREESTIRRKVKDLDLEVKKKRKSAVAVTADIKNQILVLAAEFKSAAEIGRILNLSIRTVYKTLQEKKNVE